MKYRRIAASIGGMLTAAIWLASAAAAQTSAGLVTSDPAGQYLAVKRTMQQMYANDVKGFERRRRKSPDGYDLFNCESGSDYIGPRGTELDYLLAALAHDVVVWSNDLARLNFPRYVYEIQIAGYEGTELDLISTNAGKDLNEWYERQGQRHSEFVNILAQSLTAYKLTSGAAPRVVAKGGCGAGEMSVQIVTNPRGGRILFIPIFFYELCKAQNLNPEDTTGCNRWGEAIDGRLSQVAGDYIYVARWPDGTTRRGRLTFNNKQDGQTVVLQKSR
jgi:hypothetical protein